MRKLLVTLAIAVSICTADEPQSFKTSLSCPSNNLLSGDLITKICWSCVFPIRIAGSITVGGDAPPRASGVYKPTDQIGCVCTDELGVPHIGFTLSLWEPARLIELVRNPGCSTLLGIKFPLGLIRTTGFSGDASYDASDQAFRNYHYYLFPLLPLLDLLHKNRCYSDGFAGDIDVLYLSEMDPTWNNDELALLTAMESLVFSNPIALSACLVDSISSSAGIPQNALFWCAGTWGFMYPLSGNAQVTGASPRFTSLQAARTLFALHRRGLAHRTMGNDVLCRAKIHPFIVKSQYKLSMVYPLPEAKKNHWIGETPYKWGIWRNYPGHGEDHVYLLWRWHDCCSSIKATN
jgi:conjugal transfer pilus assembly protein TraU